MKFLCDNCKAKYQIPDEKIRGRTLKMKCRKCEHPILIKGPQPAAAPAAPAAPKRASASPSSSSSSKPAGRRRGGSSVGPRPVSRPAPSTATASALGAEFRRGGSLAPEPAPQRTAVEWYAAINDVPVGPIKRDELARKIGTGAVHGKSLAWREGMDDWKPLEQIPELASLLASRRVPAPPPPVAGRGAPKPPPRAKEPSGRSNVVPIGGRMGATAFDDEDEKTVLASLPSMGLDQASSPDHSPLPIGEPAAASTDLRSFQSAPPQSMDPPPASLTPAPPATRGLPPFLLIALVGVGAFGVALAVIVGKKILADDPQVAQAPVDPLDQVEDYDPDLELELGEEDLPEETSEVPAEEETPEEATDDAPVTAMATTSRRATNTGSTGSASTMQLSAEQQALLERLSGSGGGPTLSGLDMSGSTTSSRAELDASAVRRVVSAQTNQRALRRCYETAIRGAGDAPSVRMDVQVRVGASGTVTRVSATGQDFNGLRACIERTVRRWRFPASSAGGETRFPVVFAPTG